MDEIKVDFTSGGGSKREKMPLLIPINSKIKTIVSVVCALVGEEQRTPDIAFDGVLVGREREEKLMETLHVRFRFNRSVLCHIL